MPISGAEFELGHTEPTLFILEILRDCFPNAINESELFNKVASNRRDVSMRQLTDILHMLINSNKVECKSIENIIYYRYKKRPLGFRPDRR